VAIELGGSADRTDETLKASLGALAFGSDELAERSAHGEQ
jgi:hypothetical protein